MQHTDVPEYFYANLPFNPNIDINNLSSKIEKEINRYYPLWEKANVRIKICLDNCGDHVLKVLYGSKKRSEFNSFDGLRLSSIIKSVYSDITGFSIDTMAYGWGCKEDGSSYNYNELYCEEVD